jgi:hypothetical protein
MVNAVLTRLKHWCGIAVRKSFRYLPVWLIFRRIPGGYAHRAWLGWVRGVSIGRSARR